MEHEHDDSCDHDFEEPLVNMPSRPRRNRRTPAMRRMVREHRLSPDHLIWPLFLIDGQDRAEP
ncbi:MAG: hypothetical protein KDB53_01310, partial [Planctomycetes bacterium]|nr:hypothetical protein [Planctomycetota bacterium]